MSRLLPVLLALAATLAAHADDGYRLWLRYEPLPDAVVPAAITLATPAGAPSATLAAAQDELRAALTAIAGRAPEFRLERLASREPRAGDEGFVLSTGPDGAARIAANSGAGALYGAFALIRQVQLRRPLDLVSAPRVERRMLNHWDDLNRFVERGYAGFSLWEWFHLPGILNPRYRDYARALASVGLNGTVLTNVNANAEILTPRYLAKVTALADVFRPWGVRVYLTARFSAPVEIGGLPTADPLDPAVAAWWRAKAGEIYALIPDFGGFLVKANSEGQPGPQDYGRTHADGANVLAAAVAPHGGIVLWRAFVYSPDNREDRVKQAVTEFEPFDGSFAPNVVVQIKNGPLDFMPREPFSPLFSRMPRTSLALEFQVTQEYLGQGVELAFLAPLWREVLDSDSFVAGPGTTVARLIDGSVKGVFPTVIAGVANTGTDRNWTGHLLSQSNWYAFGRLAWDHSLSSGAIADEWTRLTFGHGEKTVSTISRLLLGSRETVVNYSMPLGLHHIMGAGHHYGPGPWVDSRGRDDWNATYYHRASATGVGFDRTASGSNAVGQYAPELQELWGDPAACPENLLLWFHHVPWDRPLKSGRILWDELALRYQQGVDEVRAMRREWESLRDRIDPERFIHVQQRLARQEQSARDWRDACLLYFQTFSRRPLPAGVEPPAHSLEHYRSIRLRHMPGNPGED